MSECEYSEETPALVKGMQDDYKVLRAENARLKELLREARGHVMVARGRAAMGTNQRIPFEAATQLLTKIDAALKEE